MMYRYKGKNISIRRKVDSSRLWWPSKRFLALEEAELFANHEYTKMHGLGWDDFDHCYNVERRFLRRVDGVARTARRFDAILNDLGFSNDKVYSGIDSFVFYGAEPGIASAVVAISALGGVPISSCRGHPNRPDYLAPYVAFFAKEDAAQNLLQFAESSGMQIGLINQEIEGSGGLNLYARDCMTMMTFAKMMRDRFGGVSRRKH